MSAASDAIGAGQAVLGIELGSTRIKACLIADDPNTVVAVGAHEWESELVEGRWTYSLDQVWVGLQAAYADLVRDSDRRHGSVPRSFRSIGISAMMHGYLAFDGAGELLAPFRTWRNTSTGDASAELSDLFQLNIPLRWSVAHLHQAALDWEDHVERIDHLTTLAGYVHWQLTGQRVLGVGDASGMFPIATDVVDWDSRLLARFDEHVAGGPIPRPLRDMLPKVLPAGADAGTLTQAGALLLDPTGALQAGVRLCPPEGDAGTGMVATNAVAPRTGNVSAGTSIFAMVVLERPLQHAHGELDIVTTPAGRPVAMVHCNNGASELAAWVRLFHDFSEAAGTPLAADVVYETLFGQALAGDPDAGGLLAYNHLAGEPVLGLDRGRPTFVRTPDSRFTLANTVRAQLYGVFATLALGMRVLGDEHVEIDHLSAHGGVFRTAGVAQRFLAAALNAPVSVSESAGEGGAWGAALLAAYAVQGGGRDLSEFLSEDVFAGYDSVPVSASHEDIAGFAAYLDRYTAGLDVERAAGTAL